jgi:hypothetical protein
MVCRAVCNDLVNESKVAEARSCLLFGVQFRKSAEHSPKVKRGARGRRVEEETDRDAYRDVILRAPDTS